MQLLVLGVALVVSFGAFVLVPGWVTVRSVRLASIEALGGFALPATIGAVPGLEQAIRFAPQAAVDRLRAWDYRDAGAMLLRLPDHSAVFAVLLADDGLTYAVVTPAHLTLVSDFGGKLATTSSTSASSPATYELRLSPRDQSVDSLVEAHNAQLARIQSTVDRRPDHLSETSVVDTALAVERHGLRSISPLAQTFAGATALGRRVRRSARTSEAAIRRWYGSDDRWSRF